MSSNVIKLIPFISSVDLTKLNLDSAYSFLKSDTSYSLLGTREETLSRVFAVLKSLNISYFDATFFEMGTTNFIGRDINNGLHSPNMVNFFLNQKLGLDYFGLDPLILRDDIKKYPGKLSRYFGDFKNTLNKKIDAGKVPVIFSNLVIGYCDADRDMDAHYSTNPPFWNLPGTLQIHQYLVRDVISRNDTKYSLKHEFSLNDRMFGTLNLPSNEFEKEITDLIHSAYDMSVDIKSIKIPKNAYSDTISVWKID